MVVSYTTHGATAKTLPSADHLIDQRAMQARRIWNLGPKAFPEFEILHPPQNITDLAGAIHTPLHITRITKVVEADNWVNPDIRRCQPEWTCGEWPSNLLHQGGHSEIQWWSWVPNENRASRKGKRYDIGSCFKVSSPWIGYVHNAYQRVLQWHWGHNWDTIFRDLA